MHTNFNKLLLGLKDESYKILKYYKEGRHLNVHLELEKQEHQCPRCNNNTSYVHDYRTRVIKHGNFNGNFLVFHYNRRRYICKSCNKRFPESNSFVDKYAKISNQLNMKIIDDLKTPDTFKSIATSNNVSSSTVIRRSDEHISVIKLDLPEVISLDEFKKSNSKIKDGKYALSIADPINKKIIDIIPNRRKNRFDDYLYEIPLESLKRVKIVTIDMWEPYRDLTYKHFSNAKVVIDRFHYIRQIVWWLDDIRKLVMNSYKTNQKGYKILKKHHKLLIKNPNNINHFYYPNKYFKKFMSEASIIKECLEIDDRLLSAYKLYEHFQINTKDLFESEDESLAFIDDFVQILYGSNLPNAKVLADTFINWRKEIANSLYLHYFDKDDNIKRYTNGFIEGANNFIKTIRRMSYNIRCFNRFKTRIITLFNKELMLK